MMLNPSGPQGVTFQVVAMETEQHTDDKYCQEANVLAERRGLLCNLHIQDFPTASIRVGLQYLSCA